MTKLNVDEASLLEASDELDPAASERLNSYFDRHPGARAQFDQVKAELDLLRTLPRPALTDAQKLRYVTNIKGGIHKKLRQIDRQQKAERRSRFIYGALAGISAAAAAFVVAACIFTINQSATQTIRDRQAAQLAAENTAQSNVMAYLVPLQDSTNPYDQTLSDVQQSINQLQTESPALAGIHDTDMSNLLDALASVPSANDKSLDPGAL